MKNILSTYLLFFCLSQQLSGVPYNQEFKINTYNKDSQIYPFVKSLSNNSSFIVCWESYKQDGSDIGIYGQLFDKNSEKIGTEFQVNTYTNYSQCSPSIGILSDSGFVICWQSYWQDGDGYGIYGQLYDQNGKKKGSEFKVNTYTNDDQRFPSVCGLSNGNYIICWESEGQEGDDNNYGIYGQLFDKNSEKIGTEFQVNTYTNYSQGSINISSLLDGGFIICWDSYLQDGDDYGIYGQLYDQDGEKKGSEFQVNTYTNDSQGCPRVSTLSDGSFVICWISNNQDGDGYGIYGQRYDQNSAKIGSEFQVNTYTISDQWAPSISSMSNGGFIICWQSYSQDGYGYGIYGQLYDQNGVKKGSEFQVNTFTKYSQISPSVSSMLDDGFIICWQSPDQDGDGIYGKYYINELHHSLVPFALKTPRNDETLYDIKHVLCWDQASQTRINLPYELEYHVYLNDNINFSSPKIIKSIYDTTCFIDSLKPGNTYFWKVLAKNIDSDSLWSTEINGFFVSYDASLIKNNSTKKLSDFQLLEIYPNPSNSGTTIKYRLKKSGYINLRIYNLVGQEIETLVERFQQAGEHEIVWHPNGLPSGIYFYKLQTDNFSETKKLILQR